MESVEFSDPSVLDLFNASYYTVVDELPPAWSGEDRCLGAQGASPDWITQIAVTFTSPYGTEFSLGARTTHPTWANRTGDLVTLTWVLKLPVPNDPPSADGKYSKPLNLLDMLATDLAASFNGQHATETILNPWRDRDDSTWFGNLYTLGDLKRELKADGRFKNTLSLSRATRGGLSTSAAKQEAAAKNLAKARVANEAKALEQARKLVEMDYTGATTEEIAEALDLSEASVPSKLSRARTRLQMAGEYHGHPEAVTDVPSPFAGLVRPIPAPKRETGQIVPAEELQACLSQIGKVA